MRDWNSEQRMIADAFQHGMTPFQKEPIVLYGIGQNTPAVLELTHGFTIAGLLDREPDNVGKILYGKPVLSLQEAAAVSKRIVIIAQTMYVPIIYWRIKDFTQEHGISVYNYAGQRVEECENEEYAVDPAFWMKSFGDLKVAIETHDIISFDIFDTLLGRRVLRPRDVFDLVERDLAVPFASLRVQAEAACGYAASLDEIYRHLHLMGITKEDCRDWRAREFDWEKKLIFPRRKVVEAFQYARSLGKKVYLTSDMYLPKGEMTEILEYCGITGYDGLLISCEERALKSDGSLFARLRDIAGCGTFLHIGDHAFHDGAIAQEEGLDTFHVHSGYELLAASGIRSLLAEPPEALGDRLALGMLCAKLFEDPFALHETAGKLELSRPVQLGYCFLGPWALGFMQWAANQAAGHGIREFLFPSRDGFLFYRVGQSMQQYGYLPGVSLRYIKASRRALEAASIETETDLKRVAFEKTYNGTLGGLLEHYFQVAPRPSDTEQDMEVTATEACFQYLCSYLPEIMRRSAWERKNYRAYLASNGLFHSKKTAVFDFCAAGTVQYYLERQLGKPLLGLYFAAREVANTGGCYSISSAFGKFSPYSPSDGSVLSRIYLLLETLLVDGDPALLYFDEQMKPVFRRNEGVCYDQALQIQDYVLEFVGDYLSLFGAEAISLSSVDQFMEVLFGQGCEIVSPAADAFVHDDTWLMGPAVGVPTLLYHVP